MQADTAAGISPDCRPTLSCSSSHWAAVRRTLEEQKAQSNCKAIPTRTVANGLLGSCARFSRWLRFQSTAPTNQPAGFGPIQPTKRAIQDASLLEQGGTEALQLDENVQLGGWD